MNICAVAKATGIPPKTIRFYESVGLLPQVRRSPSGYRLYDEEDVLRLGFVRRARRLGFAVAEVAALLALWQDQTRASAEVKAMALSHIAAIDDKIAELKTIRATLAKLAEACHGDARPHCPILEDLAGTPAA